MKVQTKKSNILFILTDDQDVQMGSLSFMPKLKEHLIDRGLQFQHHYCTVALCCPSRVSLWTGKAARKSNECFPRIFRQQCAHAVRAKITRTCLTCRRVNERIRKTYVAIGLRPLETAGRSDGWLRGLLRSRQSEVRQRRVRR